MIDPHDPIRARHAKEVAAAVLALADKESNPDRIKLIREKAALHEEAAERLAVKVSATT